MNDKSYVTVSPAINGPGVLALNVFHPEYVVIVLVIGTPGLIVCISALSAIAASIFHAISPLYLAQTAESKSTDHTRFTSTSNVILTV